MLKTYLGIDPGLAGGLVALNGNGDVISAKGMPPTESDIYDWFVDLTAASENIFAYIEKVGGFIQGGEGRQPGSAMFKFGQSYGGLRMALVAAAIPFQEITPQAWQKVFGIRRAAGVGRTEWKNQLKAKAQQLFPRIKVTLSFADALLIAETARRKQLGIGG